MLYIKYPPNGLIRCEHDKCGEWHHGGHVLDDLLPGDTLRIEGGNNCCLGCGCSLSPGLNFGDLCIWGQHGMCMANVAARVATRFGGVDGGHHKQWVIDQMLRSILGNKDYQAWVERMNSDPDYDPWDTGIAP